MVMVMASPPPGCDAVHAVCGTDGLVAYRCNPHTDAKDAAARGAELLDRIVIGGGAVVVMPRHPCPRCGRARSAAAEWSLLTNSYGCTVEVK
jgi:microcystin degradation protein MlrC